MRLFIIFILFFTFSNAQAEVKPTFNKKFDLTGGVVDHPADVKFSPDGKKVFLLEFSSGNDTSDVELIQFSLTRSFDISSIDTSTKVSIIVDAGVDPLVGPEGFAFGNDGQKVFIIDFNRKLQVNTLETAYDLSSSTRVADDSIDWKNYSSPTTAGGVIEQRDIEFNNDGTKMFFIDSWADESVVTYNLSTPYDQTTATLGPELDLNDVNTRILQDIEFDDDGTRMYIIESHTGVVETRTYVYKLSTPFNVSTGTYVGNSINIFTADGDGQSEASQGRPLGMTFSSDGMKLYRVTYSHSGNASDNIYEYDLSCPYGIVICENETTSIVGAQIEIAKNVIHHNSSTIFKRFEWLRRNDNRNNLNNHNIKLDINNPILASLKNRLQTSLKDIKYTQASLKKENSSNNKRNWSYWSHVDISLGRVGENNFIKPKEIRTKGIMIGADKLINKKIFGLALRYGNDDIEIKSSTDAKLKSQALTLNIYGNLPLNEKSNLNALLGASLLSIEQLLSETVTGKRYGKQIFASMSYEDENNYTKYDLIPYGKIEMGITQFSDYTDFGTSSTNNVETHDKFDFKSGNASAGFKFDSILYMNDRQLSRNGFVEYIADLTPDIDHRYKNHADNVTVTNTIKKHSLHNIKGNIGFEFIKRDGYTIGINYERFQSLSRGGHSDSLLFKFGKKQIHNANFDVIYEPLKNNKTEISYSKNLNGLDVKFSSNYSLMSKIPDYGANLEVSGTF